MSHSSIDTHCCSTAMRKNAKSLKLSMPTLSSKWYSLSGSRLSREKSNVSAPVVSRGVFQNLTILATGAATEEINLRIKTKSSKLLKFM